MRYWILCLGILLLLGGFAHAQDTPICPGSLPARMVVGQNGRVTPGTNNNLRAEPSKNADKIGQIRGGDIFTVIGGPTCADGLTWWQVDYGGVTGWTVEGADGEYWLEPVDESTCRWDLIVGQQAQILIPTPLNVKPLYDSKKLADLPDNALVDIIGGPECNEVGNVWAQARYQGVTGWFTTAIQGECEGWCGPSPTARLPLLPLQTVVPPVGDNPLLPQQPSVTLSPKAVTSSNADQVRILKTLGDGYITGFRWSPDGKQLALATSTNVRLYNPRRLNAPLQTFREFSGVVNRVAYSPDGKWLATGDSSGEVHLWEIPSGVKVSTLKGSGSIAALAFSPDGKQLLTADKTGAHIWSLDKPQKLAAVRDFTGLSDIYPIYTPDGAHLLLLGNGRIDLADPASGQISNLMQRTGGLPQIETWAISPDSHYISIILSEVIGDVEPPTFYYLMTWDMATGESVGGLSREYSRPNRDRYPSVSLVYSPDGKDLLVTLDDKQEVLGTDMMGTGFWHIPHVVQAVYSPDSSLIAFGGSDGTVMLYTSEGRYLDTLYGGAGWVGGLGFSPDGAYLAALGYDNGFRVWDVKTRKRLGTVQLQAITGDFWISPDETKLLTKGKTWDLQSGKPLSAAIKLTGTPLVFRADGKLLIYSDKQVVVHDIATGEDINKVPAEWTLAGIVLSRDGSRLAYGGVSRGEPSVMVVDTNTGAILKTFERYFDEPPSDLLLSPDNRLLVVVDFRHVDERGQYHLLIWEIASGNLLTDQDVGADFVSHLDYSPRGDRIAWVSIGPESEHSPRTLHILNVNSREVASVKLSFDFVSTVKFSTDGSLVAIGDSVGSIHLYDAQTGLEAAVLTGHTGWVRQLTFNTDGSRLYSSGDDGLLRVWGLP